MNPKRNRLFSFALFALKVLVLNTMLLWFDFTLNALTSFQYVFSVIIFSILFELGGLPTVPLKILLQAISLLIFFLNNLVLDHDIETFVFLAP